MDETDVLSCEEEPNLEPGYYPKCQGCRERLMFGDDELISYGCPRDECPYV